jgi:hypothetical protein
MTSVLYRCVIWLHPPSFRRRFGDEMLWIFEEAAKEMGPAAFLVDGLASLVRQWAMNPTVWKVPVIAFGAVLPFCCIGILPRTYRDLNEASVLSAPDFFLVAVLAPLVTVSLGLIFAVSWFRFVQRRR